MGYSHDADSGKGTNSALFRARLEPERYVVRVTFPANARRSAAVPVAIQHAGGKTVVPIKEQRPAPIDGLFVPVGTYEFDGPATVEIRNEGTTGHMIVDGVQLVKVAK